MERALRRIKGEFMRQLTILLTLLFIIGCAGTSWEQQGKTTAQADEAVLACKVKLEADPSWFKLTEKEKDNQIEKCMAEKGYQKRTKGTNP